MDDHVKVFLHRQDVSTVINGETGQGQEGRGGFTGRGSSRIKWKISTRNSSEREREPSLPEGLPVFLTLLDCETKRLRNTSVKYTKISAAKFKKKLHTGVRQAESFGRLRHDAAAATWAHLDPVLDHIRASRPLPPGQKKPSTSSQMGRRHSRGLKWRSTKLPQWLL